MDSSMLVPDEDQGPQLAAIYIAGCVLSFIFVASRFIARFSMTGLGIDDWFMLLTWLVFLPLTIFISQLCFQGGTRHAIYLIQDPDRLQRITRMNWIAQPFAIFCLGSGKISIALLIQRLLDKASVWRRHSLYVAIGWTAINTIIMIVLTFAQCEDAKALWESSLRGKVRCWDPHVQSSFSIYGAAVHALIDFYLAALPISMIWGLQTGLRKKTALCVLLGCGSITGVCAAVKASQLTTLNERADFTWQTFSLWLWTGIEVIFLMVCGSIPALKPIYSICMGQRPNPSRVSTKRYRGADCEPRSTQRGYAGLSDGGQSTIKVDSTQPRPMATATSVSRGSRCVEMELETAFEKGGNAIFVTKTVAVS